MADPVFDGRRWRPFEEARGLGKLHALQYTRDEWYTWALDLEKRPHDVPFSPSEVYAKEWRNWEHFLCAPAPARLIGDAEGCACAAGPVGSSQLTGELRTGSSLAHCSPPSLCPDGVSGTSACSGRAHLPARQHTPIH